MRYNLHLDYTAGINPLIANCVSFRAGFCGRCPLPAACCRNNSVDRAAFCPRHVRNRDVRRVVDLSVLKDDSLPCQPPSLLLLLLLYRDEN